MTYERWLKLMRAWGFPANEDTFHSLKAAYSEKHRHYHTDKHILACLAHLDRCIPQTQHPEEVELALWFHDAIYQPLSGHNEQQSADWASSFLQANGASAEVIERVHRLIMVTAHQVETRTTDESLVVDIDLSILGASDKTYGEFEKAVRKEYRLVPMFIYRKKRASVLNSFLQRPHIYKNEPFYSEREDQARVNLANTVSQLMGRA